MHKSRDFVLEPGTIPDTQDLISSFGADLTIDITEEICPMTFVRTRLALDRLAVGRVLRVELRGEEPRNNVPRSARELGHAVIAEQTGANGITTVLILKQ